MEKRRAWVKWYPTDWRADPALRMCGYAARGLWADLLSLMMESERFGYLLVKGRAPTTPQLAGLLGGSKAEVTRLLDELHDARVFNRTGDPDMPNDVAALVDAALPAGIIVSRRMLRDKAKEDRDRDNGRGGGNPSLKPGVNPPDKAQRPETRDQKPDEEVVVSARARGIDAVRGVFEDLDHSLSLPGLTGSASMIDAWLGDGADLDRDVLPTIAACCASLKAKGQGPPRSFNYFRQAVADAKAANTAGLPDARPRKPGQSPGKPAFRNGWTELVHTRVLAERSDGNGHDPQDVAPAGGGDSVDAGGGGRLAARARGAH